jgi:polysaccharide biosynthesis PFTS motif protein
MLNIINYLLNFSGIRNKRYKVVCIQGYRKLCSCNRQRDVWQLQLRLSSLELNSQNYFSKSFIKKYPTIDYQLAYRQFLVKTICGVRLNAAILYAVGASKGVTYPLPYQWREEVMRSGLTVSPNSKYLWWIFISVMLVRNIQRIAIDLIKIMLNQQFNKEVKKYIYFVGLQANNISGDLTKKNIFNWYRKKQAKFLSNFALVSNNKTIKDISGKVNVSHQECPSGYQSYVSIILVILRQMQNFLNALKVAGKGCGSGLIMLHELYIAEKINTSPVERLAIEYLFHNAQHVYTPIWSLVAQERGSKVSLYFYSTNCEFLRLKLDEKINIYGYESMIWKNYYVWDEYQKNLQTNYTL